ncbi:MAG: hypothetical protein KDA85_16505, partial [Planctomycetaceae bacterium]|nr:hypothetical protein [Planctomycetaceae bacterium]
MFRSLVSTGLLLLMQFAFNPSTADAQSLTVAPLTDGEQHAIATIQEGRVLSTVSFLASDEMAGRSTPSRELEIAAAYVASRFTGAGLEGLGPDGSFYQTSLFDLVAPPADGVTLALNGTDIPGVQVLMTGTVEVRLQDVAVAEAETELP